MTKEILNERKTERNTYIHEERTNERNNNGKNEGGLNDIKK